MTDELTREKVNQMQTQTIEISDTQDIVLTNQGKVVGYIKVNHELDYIHFRGSAVNMQDFKNHIFTHNLFGASSSITTDNSNELSNFESFINALKVAN